MVGGANNRVFMIQTEDGSLVLKAYFHHPDDPRNRLLAEYTFSRFLWDNDVHAIPEPLAQSPKNHLGLYRMVAGRKLKPKEIGKKELRRAFNFIRNINEVRAAPKADLLPPGSEACFSLGEHLETVERRVAKLKEIPKKSPEHKKAAKYARRAIIPRWERLRDQFLRQAKEAKLDLDLYLPVERQCISPSDFGFHNALLTPERKLIFIDFEYAGWDDPAKLVCDFFCQEATPVPGRFFEAFLEKVAALFPQPRETRERTRMLFPLYQIKWCCIQLNDFLPAAAERRAFAHHPARRSRLEEQLKKTRKRLRNMAP